MRFEETRVASQALQREASALSDEVGRFKTDGAMGARKVTQVQKEPDNVSPEPVKRMAVAATGPAAAAAAVSAGDGGGQSNWEEF